MELIIFKSVIRLHAVYRVRLLPRGDLLTMATLMSVCQQWTQILSTQRNRRRLDGYFRRLVCNMTNSDEIKASNFIHFALAYVFKLAAENVSVFM